jgi:hypothetical protein
MNEYDIEEALRFTAANELPVLRRGAVVLSRLKDWTNNNSDGWPYWQKPGKAAAKLMDLLDNAGRSHFDKDVTEAELNKTLTPIKAFLTRQGVDQWATARIFDEPQPMKSDEQLREWIVATVNTCLDEAVTRFEGARRNQYRTPSATRVLIATADIPQQLRTMLAAKYSEKYEKE